MKLKKLTEIPPWEWPEDAASLVLNALRDRSAPGKDRLLAADLAGDMVILNEEIAETLLNVIASNDESDELRSSAAISLGPGLEEAEWGDYGDPNDIPAFSESFVGKTQHTLHTLYSDPTIPIDVRRRALEASVRNPQNWHADATRAAWAAKEGEWKLTAVFCMGFIKGFDAQILEALENADPEIHYHAVEAAGNWELDAAWPHIAQLVVSQKTEKWLLIAAIRAAASIRPHEPEIIEPHFDSEDEDISDAAMEALSEAGFAVGEDSEDERDDGYEDAIDHDFADEDNEENEEDKKNHKK